MSKNDNLIEISSKNTKEQILAAYSEVISQLNKKQESTPTQQQKQKEEQNIVSKTSNLTPDNILTDLSNLKSKSIRQIDNLSEQLLIEFQNLKNLRECIAIEKNHLEELYQINETANTLAALLQTQEKHREQFKLENEQAKKTIEQEFANQRLSWQEQKLKLEQDYKEQKEFWTKTKNREEEEYLYALESKRRKEADEYNSRKSLLEKELSDLTDNLNRREAELVSREKEYGSLKMQIEQIPDQIAAAIANAEGALRNKLVEQYEFSAKLIKQEYETTIKLKEQTIKYLEEKIDKQETMIISLNEKTDIASAQVQTIACRALDTSAQRFAPPTGGRSDEKI